ncbi:MAG: hypothetical protein E7350_05400, partial [Clostridiales bacterium]|nr:hypothetical protein [Clostridiales bacterium]
VNEAVDLVKQVAHKDANIIFGSDVRESLEDEIIVTVIATGFETAPALKPMPQQVDKPEKARLGIFGGQALAQPQQEPAQPQQPQLRNPYAAPQPVQPPVPPVAVPPAQSAPQAPVVEPQRMGKTYGASRVAVDDDMPEFLKRLNEKK